ncbi:MULTISPECIES: hypothetical protein [Streptomyces]|uniref:PH domain-containing protein n=1 Tax=Streptomyces luteosporeus TaxID=173856 RepID=A0ABN3U4H6_9ACTN
MPLRERRQQQTYEAAFPLLFPGERVELITFAHVGSVSKRRQLATTALVGVISAGTVIATVRPRQMYIVLTDRRLLFFNGHTPSGKPGKLLMDLPRACVAGSAPKNGMFGITLAGELMVAGWEKGLKLRFPEDCREEGQYLLGVLPGAPYVPPAAPAAPVTY